MPDFFLLLWTPRTHVHPGGHPGHGAAAGLDSIPFCCVYVAALLGSGVLLLTIWMEHSLHSPEISFGACLTQMFFLHFTTTAEPKILLAMAFDRFVSICFPLRYGTVLTPSAVARRAGGSAEGFSAHVPLHLPAEAACCSAGTASFIPHTYCEHMGIARLACADISANVWYGLTLPFSVGLLDLALIAISYGFILQALSGLPSCPAHLRLPRLPATALRPQHPPELPILLATLYVLLAPLLSPVVYGMRTQQIRDRALKVMQDKGKNQDGRLAMEGERSKK
uniref:G-protein coupled receptors family 1 profile domain-containing protein n=1 Tax=Taeniopygia guttata TaxID=59729 RepID=A0A674GSD0_TAEGU